MISRKADQEIELQTKRVRKPKPHIDKDEVYRKLRLAPYEAAYFAGISEGLMWRFVSGEQTVRAFALKYLAYESCFNAPRTCQRRVNLTDIWACHPTHD